MIEHPTIYVLEELDEVVISMYIVLVVFSLKVLLHWVREFVQDNGVRYFPEHVLLNIPVEERHVRCICFLIQVLASSHRYSVPLT